MDRAKEQRLEAAGWVTVTVGEFLDLTAEQEAYIEVRHQLTEALRDRRRAKKWTRSALAKRLGVEARVIEDAEVGVIDVPLDVIIRALLVLGATPADIGGILGAGELSPAA